ncbi:UDP-N-acetylmuramate dehydrogenase [Atopostipes suicloacalis DSM 15692]|uniref:UDP-N-acetylenolpyruvoylglucosamine reductase n=1 Tax=Atopostipes suicloacalis DSM 15692 TaxID=1121025 RepID=A0A1M4WUK9_9LACT|nr:UDP-N-acetylmuramate dehydrogenase [Atopostipes suicloacalis]SHE84885.1 UDP-N-acetylmuramate dehydrogenase [Atopostipes suicloacalis DSM 15692]
MNYTNLIKQFPNLIIKENEPLSNYSYTKTGGPADILFFPASIAEVTAVINWTREEGYPLTILGNASNLIVRDGGIRGVTVILTELNQITVDKNRLIADSGAPIIEVSQAAYEAELTGLEFACGIPGSTGGAVYMNAGAYEGEVKDVIEKATILTLDGDIIEVSNENLEFSYRTSKLQSTHDIVLDVTFKLKSGNPEKIKDRMDELTFLRTSKQPLEYPSCGSVFKRPTGHFTGKLIQDAGLQGLTWGGAQVSIKHAGFIVNIDNATATDYIELIEHIQEVILEKFDVELEREVRIIGESIEETSRI